MPYGFSRYLLGFQGLAGTQLLETKRVFTRLTHEYVLPTRISVSLDDTTIPPAGNRSAQQRQFNEVRTYLNEVWSHESLDDQTPASLYEASPRPMLSKPSSPEYPAHFEVRKVSTRWHSAWINVTHLLGGEYIGFEEIAPGVWPVPFGPVSPGWLHIDKRAILDHDGSSSRNPPR